MYSSPKDWEFEYFNLYTYYNAVELELSITDIYFLQQGFAGSGHTQLLAKRRSASSISRLRRLCALLMFFFFPSGGPVLPMNGSDGSYRYSGLTDLKFPNGNKKKMALTAASVANFERHRIGGINLIMLWFLLLSFHY